MPKIIKSVDDAINLIVGNGYERGDILFRGQISNWEVSPSILRKYQSNLRRLHIYETASIIGKEHAL